MSDRPCYVTFGNKKREQEFESLKEGTFEDKQLYSFIERAIKDLKANPLCGLKVPKTLWPTEYVKKYEITNLWKYDLPNGWRLTYTIQTNKIMILNIILEWFSHKEYERRFKY